MANNFTYQRVERDVIKN